MTVTDNAQDITGKVKGNVAFPKEWIVFAPFPFEGGENPELPEENLTDIPEKMTIAGQRAVPAKVKPTRSQYNFSPFFGDPPYDDAQMAYVFLPLESDAEQEVTLGMGADWYLQAWLNGTRILNTMPDGNNSSPAAINNYLIDVQLKKGRNVLALRFINGVNGAVVAAGGPEELRAGDFISIMPPLDKELDAEALMERYPADPQAPIKWRVPEGFDPRADGLGLPAMNEAEHFELLNCIPSKAPLDEGGTGKYESLRHGTWNHNIAPLVPFKDRLIGVWQNHALDENGPGGRVLARVGKIINDSGEVDWNREGSLIEPAPAPVPVRRRKEHSDHDAIRGAKANGTFQIIGDRLFFCGSFTALHGVTTDASSRKGQVFPVEHFRFGRGPDAPRAGFVRWDLGVRFYQEWAVKDDRLQPVSPLYKDNEQPEEIQLTPELTLPLEPLVPPYSDAPLLSEAPQDFQDLVLGGDRKEFSRVPRFPEGGRAVDAEGHQQIAAGHGSTYRRPDGAWVAVVENKASQAGPFYYSAEKAEDEPFFPPPRRSNLFGGVKPAAGELPDERDYIICNSPNRRNMYLLISEHGRQFNQTWLLRHERLSDYTPGSMKSEGGPGSGPQYFKAEVVGESLWIIYSISKEHVGATRVPISSLSKPN